MRYTWLLSACVLLLGAPLLLLHGNQIGLLEGLDGDVIVHANKSIQFQFSSPERGRQTVDIQHLQVRASSHVNTLPLHKFSAHNVLSCALSSKYALLPQRTQEGSGLLWNSQVRVFIYDPYVKEYTHYSDINATAPMGAIFLDDETVLILETFKSPSSSIVHLPSLDVIQTIESKSPLAASATPSGWLSVANNYDHETKSTRTQSYVYSTVDGRKVKQLEIDTHGAMDTELFEVDGRLFVLYVNSPSSASAYITVHEVINNPQENITVAWQHTHHFIPGIRSVRCLSEFCVFAHKNGTLHMFRHVIVGSRLEFVYLDTATAAVSVYRLYYDKTQGLFYTDPKIRNSVEVFSIACSETSCEKQQKGLFPAVKRFSGSCMAQVDGISRIMITIEDEPENEQAGVLRSHDMVSWN